MKLTFDDAEYTLSDVGMGVVLEAEERMRDTDDALIRVAEQTREMDVSKFHR